MKKIIPAVLANTIEELSDKLSKISSFSDEIQIDIMDGAFVIEKSFDLVDLKELPSGKDYEIHLMVAHPLEYMGHMKRLNIKKVIFHDEIDEDTLTDIEKFKAEGLVVFLAINPETEPEKIEKYIPKIDGVMLMSVEPGKGGQELIHYVLGQVRYLRAKYPSLIIEIDGGVNKENIEEVFASGVNIVAIGSGILKAEDPEQEWMELQKYTIQEDK